MNTSLVDVSNVLRNSAQYTSELQKGKPYVKIINIDNYQRTVPNLPYPTRAHFLKLHALIFLISYSCFAQQHSHFIKSIHLKYVYLFKPFFTFVPPCFWLNLQFKSTICFSVCCATNKNSKLTQNITLIATTKQ